ncbi:hypothetical protein E2562_036455 [Oryza meyeriana var. granulata]|uniref:Uncharacterized protein n=1 Tax=Oryza meyeriana var. granulata TaxID=110450 RepID=A0A6G1DAK5_9ORYZ|nr:hypothetical protein E2562_036455 [Oryza meyeriana var. granulata]
MPGSANWFKTNLITCFAVKGLQARNPPTRAKEFLKDSGEIVRRMQKINSDYTILSDFSISTMVK